MIRTILGCLYRVLPVLIAVSGATAAEPAILAKARAYIGAEEALQSVRSIHYKGSIQAEGDVKMSLEIIFQKPFQQRLMISGPKILEITALDEYEAWRRVQDAKDPTGWRLTLLRPDQVKRLRANTFENLAFYRGLEERGGTIEDAGDVSVEGKMLRKITFRHTEGIVFHRFFDPSTGRLVQTETGQGLISEEGEIHVNGMRFPKRVITKSQQTDGKWATVTIEFESVTLNEPMARSLFAVPPLTNQP